MLSIITPHKNRAKDLEKNIQHLAKMLQSGEEHIVVDGASGDNSIQILEQYSYNNPGLRWVSRSDSGIAQAINEGIRLAKNPIISILNVRDYYLEESLASIRKAIAEVSARKFFIWGNSYIVNKQDQVVRGNIVKDLNKANLFRSVQSLPANPAQYFYHKDLHQLLGFYDEHLQYTFDIDFLLKVACNNKIDRIYLDQFFANYLFDQGEKTFDNYKSLHYQKELLVLRLKHIAGYLNIFSV